MRRVSPHIIAIVLLSVFAWAPLVNGYYFFNAHDARHSVFFLIEFDQAIKDGAWYPRWGTDFALGYGYPLFNVYAPLAYYVAEGFVLLGIGYVDAVKAVYALATVGSGVSMYLFGRRALNPVAGLVAAVVYMYVPYHILDIYVRSAYAEYVAFAIMPLVLWSFHAIATRNDATTGGRQAVRHVVAGGLCYGALILTHNATALIFTPLLLGYCAWLILMQRERLAHMGMICLRVAAAGAVALGISAIFWLPMVAEAKFVQVEQWTSVAFDFTRHFVYFFQFLSPYWGYRYSGEGPNDETPFQIGMAAVALALVAAVLICRRACPKDLRWQGIFFIAMTATLAFLMTGRSAWLWGAIPAASLVQFPWRLLALTALTVSALAGVVFAAVRPLLPTADSPDAEGNTDQAAAVASVVPVLLVIILSSYSYLAPQYTDVKPTDLSPVSVIEFETFSPADRVGATAWVKERPITSPLVEQYRKGEPLTKAVALTGGGQVETVRHGGASEAIRVKSSSPSTIMFYTYYFPGWKAYVDGRPAEIYPSTPQALITLDLAPGEHVVTIRFEDTPVRTAGTIVSALTLALILGLLVRVSWQGARRQPISE